MAFDPMLLSDVIPPILPKQISDKSIYEQEEDVDGGDLIAKLDPNSNKSSLSSSIDLID